MIIVASCLLACLAVAVSSNGVCFKPHEVYSTCGDSCGPTCINPYPTDCKPQCQEGCFCEQGYIRDEFGSCVEAVSCGYKRKRIRERCGPNERYRRCKRTCEPTCRHPRRPRLCDEPCFDYKCQCRNGFVRDRHGDCIPYDLCPQRKICGKNEVWSNHTHIPAAKCQKPRCENHKLPRECEDGGNYFTNGGCVCKKGFVRTRFGRCVEREKCYRSTKSTRSSGSDDCESTKTCGHHKRWKSSSRSTESTESTESKSTDESSRSTDESSDSRSRSHSRSDSRSRDKSSRCRGGFKCFFG